MKNINYLMGLVLITFISCTDHAPQYDLQESCDAKHAIAVCYKQASSDISKNIQYAFGNIGFIFHRTKMIEYDISTIMSSISNLSDQELDSLLNSSYYVNVMSEYTNFYNETINNFIEKYSAEQYCKLRHSVEQYVINGGHNTDLLYKYCTFKTSEIINIYVTACAFADQLIPVNFFIPKNTRTNALDCRRRLQEELVAVSVSSIPTLGIEIAGAVIPGELELMIIADILDAAEAERNYRQCMQMVLI